MVPKDLRYTREHEWVRVEGDRATKQAWTSPPQLAGSSGGGPAKLSEDAGAKSGRATMGITDYAQQALGDITYVELPEVGAELKQGKDFAVVESAKAASDVFAPVSGTVTEVNSALADSPELVNQDPYGEGWFSRVTGVQAAELDSLLSADEYEQLLAEEADQQ